MTVRARIGELLLEAGQITRQQLEDALEIQKKDTRRLGEIVVSEQMVTESKLTQVLSQQLSVPWVSLQYVEFSRRLLNLVRRETAQEYNLLPIYVRRGNRRRETLFVVMEDPSDEEALEAVSDYCGLTTRAMIAPPSEIARAIDLYYLGRCPDSDPLTHPQAKLEELSDGDVRSVPPSSNLLESEEISFLEGDADAANATDADAATDAATGETHTSAPDTIVLTLLDGTKIQLPARKTKMQ